MWNVVEVSKMMNGTGKANELELFPISHTIAAGGPK